MARHVVNVVVAGIWEAVSLVARESSAAPAIC
jgi:hypothetical protein